jgi:hypothetical protein
MTTPKEKSAAYWAGYHEEVARRRAREGRMGSSVALLAQHIAQDLARDNGRKQKLFARSPSFFSSMDAEEFGRASSIELAVRELQALGIEPGDNDPLAILDAHHAGRKFARDLLNPNAVKGGAGSLNKLKGGSGEAQDADEPSFIDNYLNEG